MMKGRRQLLLVLSISLLALLYPIGLLYYPVLNGIEEISSNSSIQSGIYSRNVVYTSQSPRMLGEGFRKPLQRFRLPASTIRVLKTLLGNYTPSLATNTSQVEHVWSTSANGDNTTIPEWKRVFFEAADSRLYVNHSQALARTLAAMKYNTITKVKVEPRGTEFKFHLTLSDGILVLAKPQRLPLDLDAPPDMSKDDFFERFQSEIAAFHLDRLLGQHHVPPVVSRRINIKTEILPLVDNNTKMTFFTNTEGEFCFIGSCQKKCNSAYPICGQPYLVNMSLALHVPIEVSHEVHLNTVHIFWLFSERESSAGLCQDIILNGEKHHFPAWLLNTMDSVAFDYIQGNLDRHDLSLYRFHKQLETLVLYDNGRGFARAYQDESEILYPLVRCCTLRRSTLAGLVRAYQLPGGLGGALSRSLDTEEIRALLTDPHIQAVERRLVRVLETVFNCVRGDRMVLEDSL